MGGTSGRAMGILKRNRPTEKQVTRTCNDWLRMHGITPYRRNITKVKYEHKGKIYWVKCGEPGQSDWWMALPPGGRHIELEYKRPGEWPEPDQIKWMIMINMQGAVAFWASDLSHVELVIGHVRAGGSVRVDPDGRYELTGG